jgi:hypothetical protein
MSWVRFELSSSEQFRERFSMKRLEEIGARGFEPPTFGPETDNPTGEVSRIRSYSVVPLILPFSGLSSSDQGQPVAILPDWSAAAAQFTVRPITPSAKTGKHSYCLTN